MHNLTRGLVPRTIGVNTMNGNLDIDGTNSYRALLSLLNEAAYAAYRKAPPEDRDVLIGMLRTTDRLVDDLD